LFYDVCKELLFELISMGMVYLHAQPLIRPGCVKTSVEFRILTH
jgi:hypothetical protein